MPTSETPDVRPGQVWADNDPRLRAEKAVRHVTVQEVVTELQGTRLAIPYAIVRSESGRRSTIRLSRFRPTSSGYRLVSDVPATNPTKED